LDDRSSEASRAGQSLCAVDAEKPRQDMADETGNFETIDLFARSPVELTNQFLAGRLPSTSLFLNVHKIRVESDNKR